MMIIEGILALNKFCCSDKQPQIFSANSNKSIYAKVTYLL